MRWFWRMAVARQAAQRFELHITVRKPPSTCVVLLSVLFCEDPAMVVERARRRFSLPEYERLIETGFFGADERLELVDGQIVPMNPIGVRHAACVTRLNALLGRRLAARAVVS